MPRSCSRLSMPRSLPLGWLIALPEQNEHLADLLHRLAAGLRADRGKGLCALLAFHAGRAHLDELVRCERAIDLGDHFRGEAFAADDDHWLEAVRAGLQFLALGGAQHE